MQKTTAFLISVLIFSLLLPLTTHSADSRTADQDLLVLTSEHKFTPAENSDGAEPETVATSSQPSPNASSPVLLDRSPDSKRRPDFAAKFSDGTFRRQLSARSAIILDAHTGEEIYSHNPDLPRQPASTIKVLTGLLAIDYLKNDSLVPVSGWAASMPRSKIYIKKGESYYATDLINAVLLASANDASVALAEKIAGSETKFAGMMTRKASELGATSTVCKTASGLTAQGQQTTARDLATIFGKAMQHQEFSDRIKKLKTKTSYGKLLRSHNRAMWQITGSQGGKTGYTWAAKQTYVGKFSRNGQEIVVALLGSRNMWGDIAKLVDYGFSKSQQMKLAENKTDTPVGKDGQNTVHTSSLVVLTDSKKSATL